MNSLSNAFQIELEQQPIKTPQHPLIAMIQLSTLPTTPGCYLFKDRSGHTIYIGKAKELKKEQFGTHYDNVKLGEEEGLICLYTIVSNHDDWDHYETLQWWAVDDYVRANPDDSDNPELLELLERTRTGKESYLRWGRDTIGWAVYVFRKR